MLRVFLFSALFLLAMASQAQKSIWIFGTSTTASTFVVISQEKDSAFMAASIARLPQAIRERHHFLILFGEKMDSTRAAKAINNALIGPKRKQIDPQQMYLLIHKADPVLENYLKNRLLFADFAFVRATENEKSTDLAATLAKLDDNHLWSLDFDAVVRKGTKTTHKNRPFSIGLLLRQNVQSASAIDSIYIPKSMTSIGLLANYRLANRWNLMAKTTGSFKIPNRKKMQSEIFNQIDISAGGEQTVSLKMKMHVFLQSSLQGNFDVLKRRNGRAFVGAGVSMVNFRAANAEIEQTIDLSNISSGGGPPDLGGEGFGDLPLRKTAFVDPFLSVGFEFKKSPRVSFFGLADYHFLKRDAVVRSLEVPADFNRFSVSGGLQFHFGKKNRTLDYLVADKKSGHY